MQCTGQPREGQNCPRTGICGQAYPLPAHRSASPWAEAHLSWDTWQGQVLPRLDSTRELSVPGSILQPDSLCPEEYRAGGIAATPAMLLGTPVPSSTGPSLSLPNSHAPGRPTSTRAPQVQHPLHRKPGKGRYHFRTQMKPESARLRPDLTPLLLWSGAQSGDFSSARFSVSGTQFLAHAVSQVQ